MKVLILCMTVVLALTINYGSAPSVDRHIEGRWKINFELSGAGQKSLTVESQSKGLGVVYLLDPGLDNKATTTTQPATWALNTNSRVDISSQVELQLGNCCRELGTIIFKGKFESDDLIKGKVIFIAATIDEENFNGYRSTVGTFTATRQSK